MHVSSDEIMQMQRICQGCKSFVTLHRGEDLSLICPLCGRQAPSPPVRTKPLYAAELRALLEARKNQKA